MSPNALEDRGDLFLLKMKEARVIDKAVFSISIDLKNDRSMITFGGFNLKKYAEPGA